MSATITINGDLVKTYEILEAKDLRKHYGPSRILLGKEWKKAISNKEE